MATSKSVAEADPVVERAREELMQLETEVENVEKELVKQQNRLLKPIWEKRKAILSKIPDFWSVAVTSNFESRRLELLTLYIKAVWSLSKVLTSFLYWQPSSACSPDQLRRCGDTQPPYQPSCRSK
ncbi:hypothetical protein BC936DRAFT_143705 [Jimgerdemannia flammicorona]|uniref:Uncharacterized protein n=1 Tax=Jimgerdemannia flammicorona TaxID=994334 RepID=A0A433DMC3_9FUNG|nr:hypothetical protein BC936DRAFT_143705 [Jimgerdemannia flammicorona]